MKIIVCIKQVPDTSDIRWTSDNTIKREGVESILNPMDLYAIEAALKIKDSVDSEIIVVSMGPLQAKEVIKKAISMGCDRGYLLSDKNFAGSDTYATARVLSKFISSKASDFDLIICGQYASDGDTAQTGPSLASQLGISQVTNVKHIDVYEDHIIAERETELFFEKYFVKFPSLICVSSGGVEPRRPKIDGFINSKNTKIEVLSCKDIDISPEETGLKGSPTYVSKAFSPEIKHDGEMFFSENLSETVNILKNKIKDYV